MEQPHLYGGLELVPKPEFGASPEETELLDLADEPATFLKQDVLERVEKFLHDNPRLNSFRDALRARLELMAAPKTEVGSFRLEEVGRLRHLIEQISRQVGDDQLSWAIGGKVSSSILKKYIDQAIAVNNFSGLAALAEQWKLADAQNTFGAGLLYYLKDISSELRASLLDNTFYTDLMKNNGVPIVVIDMVGKMRRTDLEDRASEFSEKSFEAAEQDQAGSQKPVRETEVNPAIAA